MPLPRFPFSPSAGHRWQINHRFDTRVLFDYYFPGVIPGSAVRFPAGVDFATQLQPAVIAAIVANPAAAIELAAVDQVEQYGSFSELVQTLVTSFTSARRGGGPAISTRP